MNSVPTTFWQWFTSLDTGDLAGLSILAVSGLVVLTLILSMTAYFMHKNRLQHALKREMLDRGFDAEEIALAVHGTPRIGMKEPNITDPFRALQVKQ